MNKPDNDFTIFVNPNTGNLKLTISREYVEYLLSTINCQPMTTSSTTLCKFPDRTNNGKLKIAELTIVDKEKKLEVHKLDENIAELIENARKKI